MAHALSISRRRLIQALPAWLLPWGGAAQAAGYALFDRPKYGPGFTHFDYVDPRAPVGGSLWLTPGTAVGSFDKLNPYILRGTAAPGLDLLVFESLMTPSWDEPNSIYGLLAEDVEVAADGLSARFRLHPGARFSNGDAVTAGDVRHSFERLTGAHAAPPIRAQFQDVARAVAEDPRHVRFDFRRALRDLPLLVAGMPVFSPKWGAGKAFDDVVLEAPIASGPYRIARTSGQHDIVYARRADYWGQALPSRRGQFNFAEIGYRLYQDGTARLEAFKAGEFDLVQEFIARVWARQYVGPRFSRGEVVRRELPNRNPAGFQGFVFNLRRPLFQDPRVRQALNLALDFDWLNRRLFYDSYVRIRGYFANTPFEARGLPDAAELELLEPLRAQLPPTVFGPPPQIPGTAPPGSLRANLLAARELLRAAGWHVRDGALRDARGRRFVFEYLDGQEGMVRVLAVYARALARLGIEVQVRLVDFALYIQRVENFDFDITSLRLPGSPSPGDELRDEFGSVAAITEGSSNLWGLRSPAVDTLIGHVQRARTGAALRSACRALDRALRCGWYSVPHWYAANHRVAYTAGKFGMPATLPLYYTPDNWAASCWWARPGGAS